MSAKFGTAIGSQVERRGKEGALREGFIAERVRFSVYEKLRRAAVPAAAAELHKSAENLGKTEMKK